MHSNLIDKIFNIEHTALTHLQTLAKHYFFETRIKDTLLQATIEHNRKIKLRMDPCADYMFD